MCMEKQRACCVETNMLCSIYGIKAYLDGAGPCKGVRTTVTTSSPCTLGDAGTNDLGGSRESRRSNAKIVTLHISVEGMGLIALRIAGNAWHGPCVPECRRGVTMRGVCSQDSTSWPGA